MKLLLIVLAAPLALFGLLVWPGGSQTCNNCRLEREVRVFASVEVPIWISSTESSHWVSRNLPEHEHRWIRVGCWSTLSGFALYFGGTRIWLGISEERWFSALQAAEPAERPALMQLANRATFSEDRWPEREELLRRVTELELDAEERGAGLTPRRGR